MRKLLTNESLGYMMFLILVIEVAANVRTGKETMDLRCLSNLKQFVNSKKYLDSYIKFRNKVVHNAMDYEAIYSTLSANIIQFEYIAQSCVEYAGIEINNPNYVHEAVYGLRRELKELI